MKEQKEPSKEEPEGEKKEEHGRKRHKREERPKGEGEEKGEKGDGHGLKHELSQQGREKCKFFPFCKNSETCEFFHPTDKVRLDWIWAG